MAGKLSECKSVDFCGWWCNGRLFEMVELETWNDEEREPWDQTVEKEWDGLNDRGCFEHDLTRAELKARLLNNVRLPQ